MRASKRRNVRSCNIEYEYPIKNARTGGVRMIDGHDVMITYVAGCFTGIPYR